MRSYDNVNIMCQFPRGLSRLSDYPIIALKRDRGSNEEIVHDSFECRGSSAMRQICGLCCNNSNIEVKIRNETKMCKQEVKPYTQIVQTRGGAI